MLKLCGVMLSLCVIHGLLAQDFVNANIEQGIAVSFGSGTFGGGISMADFNNDGWDDLTLK